jgi:hypothetical protein
MSGYLKIRLTCSKYLLVAKIGRSILPRKVAVLGCQLACLSEIDKPET